MRKGIGKERLGIFIGSIEYPKSKTLYNESSSY